MSLEDIREFMKDYLCPACGAKAGTVKNLSNVYFCENENCNVGYYFSEDVDLEEAKELEEKDECDSCGSEVRIDSSGRKVCLNRNCRAKVIE